MLLTEYKLLNKNELYYYYTLEKQGKKGEKITIIQLKLIFKNSSKLKALTHVSYN